jgi:hypothetical protein
LGYRLFIEPDQARLAALLSQAQQILSRHLAFAAALAVKIAMGALMHVQPVGNIRLQDRRGITDGIRKLPFLDAAEGRRFNTIVTDPLS